MNLIRQLQKIVESQNVRIIGNFLNEFLLISTTLDSYFRYFHRYQMICL